MRMQSIDIAIRSGQGRAPRVRFERSTAIPAGTISMLVVGGDLVVSCGTSAIVDAVGSTVLDGDRGTIPELALRDGDLELAVCCRGREWTVLPPAPSLEAPTRSDRELPATVAIRDAEWSPVDDSDAGSAPRVSNPPRPAPGPRVIPFVAPSVQRAAAEAVGDTPTRFQPVADPMPQRPWRVSAPARADSKAAASPPGAPSARRMMIRRIALLSMLLCAFVLMMRTRRARESRTAATARSSVAASPSRPSSAAGASSQLLPPPGQAAPLAQAAAAQAPSAAAPLDGVATGAGPGKPSSVTKARRAADALANGAYAEALALYEELGAEGGPNGPAYQETARVLRSRLQERGAAPP